MSNVKVFGSLKGTISNSGNLTGTLSVPSNIGTGADEKYSGNYEVTPHAFGTQVLNTANKLLEENITIRPIPYWETSNPANGKTVYIAEEI